MPSTSARTSFVSIDNVGIDEQGNSEKSVQIIISDFCIKSGFFYVFINYKTMFSQMWRPN